MPSPDKTKEKAADATIAHLNLNHKKLQAQRRSAIDGIVIGIETLTSDEIKILIDNFDRLDALGEYIQFHATVIYTLKQFIS